MLMKYAIGILGITGLMIAWVIVQYLWRLVFMDKNSSEDVLAGRGDCGNCGCGTQCQLKTTKK